MTPLEKYVIKNHDRFNQELPSKGHQKRFEKRLQIESSPIRRFYYHNRYAINIAASLLVIISLSIGIMNIDNNDLNKMLSSQIQKVKLPLDLQEVITFYAFQVEDQFEQIDQYAKDADEAARIKKMAKDQIRLLEVQSLELKNELELNGDDQRVRDALINNHKTRMDFLDNVIKQLKNNTL
jgi:hypothetical protein